MIKKHKPIKVQLFFSTSKLAAYIILLIGSVYSFVFKDSNVLIATFSAVSAILMMKTYTASRIETSNIENKTESKTGENYENII